MPRFFVVVKELREVETEFEAIAPDESTAKQMCEHYETYYNNLFKLDEDTVTNHSREVTSVSLDCNVS